MNDRTHPQPARSAMPNTARRRGSRSQAKRRGIVWRALSLVGIAAFGVAVLALAAVGGFLLFASPGDLVRNQIVARVQAATGREVAIDRVGFSVYPSPGIVLHGVRLPPPPSLPGADTFTAERLEVEIAFWPLIERRLQVRRIALTAPTLSLIRDRDGNASWHRADLGAARRVRLAQSGAIQTDATPSTTADLPQAETDADAPGDYPADAIPQRPRSLSPADPLANLTVTIRDGTVLVDDAQAGVRERVEQVSLDLRATGLEQPLMMTGRISLRGTDMDISAELASPSSALVLGRANADVQVTSPVATMRFAGLASIARGATLDGDVSVTAASLARLAGLADVTLSERIGDPALDFSGKLKLSAARSIDVTLEAARLTLGQATASGSVQLALGGPRPYVSAQLTASEIDTVALTDLSATLRDAVLRPRAAPGQSLRGTVDTPSPDTSARATPTGEPRPVASTDAPPAAWSEAPIELVLARVADIDATLALTKVRTRRVAIDAATARLSARDGAARLDLDSLSLYGGSGRGVVTVDPDSGGVRIATDVTLDRVAARELLADVTGIDMLAGNADVRLAVTGTGASEHAIMSSLAGSVSVSLADGAIIGWNVAELMRGLPGGNLDGLSRSPQRETDFSAMTATFQIANGVARNDDLKIVGPLVRIGGAGSIDIGGRTLDYLARPKLVASLEGQGSAIDLKGLEIPVRIAGPWRDPDVSPQLQGQVKDVVDALKKQLKGKSVGDVVNDLLKDDGKAASELLKGLFGR